MKISQFLSSFLAHFNSNKLTSMQSYVLLSDIEADLSLTQDVDMIIENIADSHDSGKQKVFKNSSGGLSETIRKVLNRREFSGLFDKTFLIIILPLLMTGFLTLLAFQLSTFGAKYFFDNYMLPNAEKMNGFAPSVDYPIYFTNQGLITVAIVLYTLFAYSLIHMFVYYYKNDCKKIYKFFKLKMLDDVIHFFTVMHEMKRLGVPDFTIYEDMAQEILPISARGMFEKMSKKDLNLYKVLEEYGISYEITKKFKKLEETDRLWEQMEYEENVNGRMEIRGFLPSLQKKAENRYKFYKLFFLIPAWGIMLLSIALGFAIPMMTVLLLSSQIFSM